MRDVYVLTGASGGIGSDYARNFTQDALLVISDLNQEALEVLKKELDTKNIESQICVCDISNPDSIKHLAEFTKSLGKFKVLIHTAGLPESNPDLDLIFKVNLIGVKYLMDAFYELCDNSVIINIASMTGHLIPDNDMYNGLLENPLDPDFLTKMAPFTQGIGTNAYSFAKKGVIMLCEKEVGRFATKNTRILSVSPGAVETAMTSTDAGDTDIIALYVKNTPIPRMAKPLEITRLLQYLCSEDAAFITGTDVLIDGGMAAQMKNNPQILG